jgi:hypothetical protein
MPHNLFALCETEDNKARQIAYQAYCKEDTSSIRKTYRRRGNHKCPFSSLVSMKPGLVVTRVVHSRPLLGRVVPASRSRYDIYLEY